MHCHAWVMETFLNISAFFFFSHHLSHLRMLWHCALWGFSHNLFSIMKLPIPCWLRGLGREVHFFFFFFVNYIYLLLCVNQHCLACIYLVEVSFQVYWVIFPVMLWIIPSSPVLESFPTIYKTEDFLVFWTGTKDIIYNVNPVMNTVLSTWVDSTKYKMGS